jgi:surface protein
MESMFNGCWSLESVPFFNTSKVTNFYFMFLYCYSLKTVPLFDVTAATTTAIQNGLQGMFYSCRSLESVPFFNTANAGNMSDMFRDCKALKTVPLFDTSKAFTTASMFDGCDSLVEIPQFNLSNSRDTNRMFYNCYSLRNVGITSLPSVTGIATTTGASNMFFGCNSLQSVDIQMPIIGSINGMFNGCLSLTAAPINFSSLSATDGQSTFQDCYNLTTVPSSYKTDLFTNMSNAFNACANLVFLPPLNVSRVATYTTTFNGCISLQSAPLSNIIANISFASCKLGISAVETIYDGLSTNPPTRTITITNNPGTILYSIASVTTSAGSISATTSSSVASITGLSGIGMHVTGTGTSLTTGRTVSFTDAGDLVNLTAHGLSDNDIVAFSVITTTTGITRYTSYYVVNATADTFQVSDTLGGPARTLTTNGTGNVIYASQITSIVAGTPNTIILSRKQASTATNTLTFRQSNVSKAIMKGWTVTGG